MNDYVYVGDICFSDYLDFSKWSFTNGTKGYSNGTSPNVSLPIVLEKISRVYNDDPRSQVGVIVDGKDFLVDRGTKYKLYIHKILVENHNSSLIIITRRDVSTDFSLWVTINKGKYKISSDLSWEDYKEKE
jgi:hypothetical protein